MAEPRLRDRARTLRVRTTAGAVLVVGTALLFAAVAIVLLLQRSLTENLKTSNMFRAEAVADLLAAGIPSDPIRVGDEEDEFVQVLDTTGTVVASSANITGEPASAPLAPGTSARRKVSFEEDTFLVVAVATPQGQPSYTILVGGTMEAVTESSQIVASLLALGLPFLLLIIGAVTWQVVGRSLAPVEAIRGEVETITTQRLHRRVPEPTNEDEIGRLAATMNAMLQRLEAGHARQQRFVSDASHELRSPVATIRQHAEVALVHPRSTTAEELARVVLEENTRLQDLVEDLLLLAHLDENPDDSTREAIDLDDLVFEQVDRLKGSADQHIDPSQVSAGRVVGDRKQLTKMVGNLLDNALRHASTSVSVSLSEAGERALLWVDDDGSGVPLEDRERIFTRFERLQEARDRDSGGSGLGLAIVAEVAASHGGQVRVTDAPAGGARFEIDLPRSAD